MYKFQHTVKDRFDNDIMEVVVSVPSQHETPAELVDRFVYFLRGCGFHMESILKAMSAQADGLDFKKDEEA